MPGLNDLQTVILQGQQAGAYMEPIFFVDGLDTPVTLRELIEYILGNLGGGGGGSDNYLAGASLNGNVLELTMQSGPDVTVDLSNIDTDTDDFVASAALQGNNLVLTMDSGGTVSVDLSSLAGGGGGTALSIYDAGLGFIVKGTAGITVISGAAGVYDIDIPSSGILESFQKSFTNAGTEFTVGGDVQLNINWNTATFNNNFSDSILPNIKLIDGAGTQREPAAFSVTVQHTSVAGGQSTTTVANINGGGTPIQVKGIL